MRAAVRRFGRLQGRRESGRQVDGSRQGRRGVAAPLRAHLAGPSAELFGQRGQRALPGPAGRRAGTRREHLAGAPEADVFRRKGPQHAHAAHLADAGAAGGADRLDERWRLAPAGRDQDPLLLAAGVHDHSLVQALAKLPDNGAGFAFQALGNSDLPREGIVSSRGRSRRGGKRLQRARQSRILDHSQAPGSGDPRAGLDAESQADRGSRRPGSFRRSGGAGTGRE